MKQLLARAAFALGVAAYSSLASAQVSNVATVTLPASLSGMGYATVAEVLSALKAMPGTVVNDSIPDAWVVVTEPGGRGVWSFTPPSHYAFPAVVKRRIVAPTNGPVQIETSSLCEATKTACDRLTSEFEALDPGIRMWLENEVQMLLRSPFYDEKSRSEEILSMQDNLAGPPIDEVTDFMTPKRAEYVRKLRVDDGYTFRALAAACAKE